MYKNNSALTFHLDRGISVVCISFRKTRFQIMYMYKFQVFKFALSVVGPDEERKVVFTATVSPPTLTNLGAGQTIIFDKVITNIGNAYDNITGVFTAPVKGVYIFDMALMTDPGDHQYLELVQNGQNILFNYGHALGGNHLVSSTRTVSVELSKGTKVWIRTQNTPTHGTGKVHGYSFSTFSGWLYTTLE